MGRALTATEIGEFLAKPYTCRLATIREDGGPYIVPVWHEYDGEALYIVARERSEYVGHIRRDGRVAMSFVEEGSQILILGQATIVEGPTTEGKCMEVAFRMGQRYGGEGGTRYIQSTLNRPRYLIRIVPEKITSWTGGDWAPKYYKDRDTQ